MNLHTASGLKDILFLLYTNQFDEAKVRILEMLQEEGAQEQEFLPLLAVHLYNPLQHHNMRLPTIAATFNRMGFRTVQGRQFSISSVLRLINREMESKGKDFPAPLIGWEAWREICQYIENKPFES